LPHEKTNGPHEAGRLVRFGRRAVLVVLFVFILVVEIVHVRQLGQFHRTALGKHGAAARNRQRRIAVIRLDNRKTGDLVIRGLCHRAVRRDGAAVADRRADIEQRIGIAGHPVVPCLEHGDLGFLVRGHATAMVGQQKIGHRHLHHRHIADL
jgi:hypothetical protein